MNITYICKNKYKMLKTLITSQFDKLEFEPLEHKYTLDGENLTSVSNVIKRFEEGFDTETKSIAYAEKYGLDLETVRANWKKKGSDACDFGHQVHDFGEEYFHNKNLKPRNGHEKAVIGFWNGIPSSIVPLLCETMIFTKKYQYAGTFDLLLYNPSEDGVIIVDYKTNKDLFKNYRGKMLLSPFDFLLDNPYNHYQIQLSLYQIPLEDAGIKVIDRWIIWLKDDGQYSAYNTYDYSNLLRTNLNPK